MAESTQEMVRVDREATTQQIERLGKFAAQTFLASFNEVKICVLSFPYRCLSDGYNSQSNSYRVERVLQHLCVVFVNVFPLVVKRTMHNPIGNNRKVIFAFLVQVCVKLLLS